MMIASPRLFYSVVFECFKGVSSHGVYNFFSFVFQIMSHIVYPVFIVLYHRKEKIRKGLTSRVDWKLKNTEVLNSQLYDTQK